MRWKWYVASMVVIGIAAPLIRGLGETVGIVFVLALVGIAETATPSNAKQLGQMQAIGWRLVRWATFVAAAVLIYLSLSV